MTNMNENKGMNNETVNVSTAETVATENATAPEMAADSENQEEKNKVKLIKNLHFGTLKLAQIEECNEDVRPLGMIYGFLQKQKSILNAPKADERDKKNAEKYKSLFFLLDSDPKALRSWLMKAKSMIDSGLVKPTDKENFIMDQLLLVKKFYQQKYSKKTA